MSAYYTKIDLEGHEDQNFSWGSMPPDPYIMSFLTHDTTMFYNTTDMYEMNCLRIFTTRPHNKIPRSAPDTLQGMSERSDLTPCIVIVYYFVLHAHT